MCRFLFTAGVRDRCRPAPPRNLLPATAKAPVLVAPSPASRPGSANRRRASSPGPHTSAVPGTSCAGNFRRAVSSASRSTRSGACVAISPPSGRPPKSSHGAGGGIAVLQAAVEALRHRRPSGRASSARQLRLAEPAASRAARTAPAPRPGVARSVHGKRLAHRMPAAGLRRPAPGRRRRFAPAAATRWRPRAIAATIRSRSASVSSRGFSAMTVRANVS